MSLQEFIDNGDYNEEDIALIDDLEFGQTTGGTWQENHCITRVHDKGRHDDEQPTATRP